MEIVIGMTMGFLPEILVWVGWVLFVVSTLLAINAGRSLAAKKHDADLAKRYGKQLSIFGLALYLYAIFSIVFSLFSTLATKALSTSLKVVAGGSILLTILTGIIYPLIVIGLSYTVFRARYSNVDEPLTREGKLAIKVAEKEVGLRRGVKKAVKPPSPLQVADKAARSVKEVTKLFIEEEKEKR